MNTASLLNDLVILDLEAESAASALRSIGNHALDKGLVAESWLDAVVKRESEFATGLPTDIPVAIPHTESMHVRADGFGFIRLTKPVQFIEMGTDDSPLEVSMIFPLLITNPSDQVELLQAVISLIQKPGVLENLSEAKAAAEVASLLAIG